MPLQDIPKKKSKTLDPKFNVEIRPARKKPGTGKRELMGKEAIDAYQRSIRPENIAKENLAAKKALEKKYPGMFLPDTRNTAGIHKKK
jgi:hypothetical protein